MQHPTAPAKEFSSGEAQTELGDTFPIGTDSCVTALLRDRQGPEGWPVWKGSSHGSTYPRGIIPADLHPLEVGHTLVLGGGGVGFLNDSQAGARARGQGRRQRGRLHADQLLPATERLGQTAPSMVTHSCRARGTAHSHDPAGHDMIQLTAGL